MSIIKRLESFQYEVRPYFALIVGIYALIQSEFSSLGALLGIVLILLSLLILYTRLQYRKVSGATVERESREVEQKVRESTHGIEIVKDSQPVNEWEVGTGKINRN